MSQWYYSLNGAQQGPVPMDQLAEWVRNGQLAPDVPVWCEGMPSWTPAHVALGQSAGAQQSAGYPAAGAGGGYPAAGYPQQQGLSYESPSHGVVPATPRALDMLRQTKPWVRFLSVLMIIAICFGALGLLISLAAISQVSNSGGVAATYTIVMGLVLMLYIVPTIFLSRYASRIGDLLHRRGPADLEAALEAQKSFWKFVGIFTLVLLCVYAVMFLVVGVSFTRFR